MVAKYGIKYFYDITDRSDFRANPDYKGVCHIAMAQEGHCLPGMTSVASMHILQRHCLSCVNEHTAHANHSLIFTFTGVVSCCVGVNVVPFGTDPLHWSGLNTSDLLITKQPQKLKTVHADCHMPLQLRCAMCDALLCCKHQQFRFSHDWPGVQGIPHWLLS